jgi:hypothetical protein
VNLNHIRIDVAKKINVDVSNIPVTVQAPIGVAANVCNIDANVLARQAQQDDASCDAKQTSDLLNELVKRRVGGAGQQGAQPTPKQ